jgi:hypothetical protein
VLVGAGDLNVTGVRLLDTHRAAGTPPAVVWTGTGVKDFGVQWA